MDLHRDWRLLLEEYQGLVNFKAKAQFNLQSNGFEFWIIHATCAAFAVILADGRVVTWGSPEKAGGNATVLFLGRDMLR